MTDDVIADAVFLAESLNEPFTEVTVITTKQRQVETAAEYVKRAFGSSVTNAQHYVMVAAVLTKGLVSAQESVTVDDDQITICLNVDTTDDEMVPLKSVRYLQQALDVLNGASGSVLFGSPIHYGPLDTGSIKIPTS